MKSSWWWKGLILALVLATPLAAQFGGAPKPAQGMDVEHFRESWRVLEPITRGNLSVYPVVSDLKVDTSQFLTLDEGLSMGAVRIGERGQVEGAIYRLRESRRWPPVDDERPDFQGGASVNELMLVNNSSRPLLLLAGEVVSGGKQNRIIGADLVIPPKSDPLPLSVFCVEHGRWSAGSSFDSPKAMAQLGMRKEAQVGKSQAGVWQSVEESRRAYSAPAPTGSYLDVIASPQARRELDEKTKGIERDFESELREKIAGRGAVGVVVAIGGELVWSDVFPSAELFRRYWPKLLRSYVIEAGNRRGWTKGAPSLKDAEAFLMETRGHVTVREEASAYRRTEVAGRGMEIVALEALGSPFGPGLLVHYNKMATEATPVRGVVD